MMHIFPESLVLPYLLTFLLHVRVGMGGSQPSAGILNSGRLKEEFIFITILADKPFQAVSISLVLQLKLLSSTVHFEHL